MKKTLLATVFLFVFNVLFTAHFIAAQTPETLPQAINRVAVQHGINPRLWGNLISQESSLKMKAYSYKGAACLTQLMPATARRFGLRVDSQVDERFVLEKCLQAGAQYFAWLLKTFNGDVRLALAGYNAGEGAVFRFGYKIPPFRETVQYVERICYRTYGQAGHALAMAYDKPRTYQWTAGLYVRRRMPGNPAPNIALTNTEPALVNAQIVSETDAPQPPADSNASASKQQKPKVVRVPTESIQPKIRTESLYFWKQTNEEN